MGTHSGASRSRFLARQVHPPRRMSRTPQTLDSAERTVPSVTDSLDRMVDAAQNVVGDQVQLLRVEVTSAVTSALQSGALVLGGTALLVVGWIIALMAAFQLLAPHLGTLGTLVVLVALNVLPGIALVMGAWRGAAELGRG
jgi:uncharacterized membrane protein YqjE